jgi:hypothetical protein
VQDFMKTIVINCFENTGHIRIIRSRCTLDTGVPQQLRQLIFSPEGGGGSDPSVDACLR